MCRDLSAELTADGATAAGDQHCFAIDEVKYFFHISLDGLSSEQVLNRYLLHLADRDIAEHELIHTGQVLEFAIGLFADVQNIPALLRSSTGNGQIDLLDLVLLHILQNGVPATHDRHAVDVASPLVGIVIDEAHDFVLDLSGSADVARNCLTRIAGADDHDTAKDLRICLLIAEQQYKAIRESDRRHEYELQYRSHNIVGNRHASEEYCDKYDVE